MAGNKLMLVLFLCCGLTIIAECAVIDNHITDTTDYFGIQIFEVERQCIMNGGICVLKKDCAKGALTSTSGLCPTNQHRGVECCYEPMPAKDITCQQQLGECKDTCGYALQRSASNCGSSQVCCVLVG